MKHGVIGTVFALVHALVLAFVLAAPAQATDVWYPDVHVASPSERLTLDAVSPDNAGQRARPFAASFVYTLRDAESQAVIWTRIQLPMDPAPRTAWIDDSMWVVVRTTFDTLDVLAPATGELAISVDLLEQFTHPDHERFIAFTSAGRLWPSSMSLFYFMPHENRMHFVVRAAWDERVVVDCANRAVLAAPSAAVLDACAARERDLVLDTLGSVNSGGDIDLSDLQAARNAIRFAGIDRMIDAVPFLRAIEDSEIVDGHWGETSLAYTPDVIYLRRRAQRALRRIGETPRDLPVMTFAPGGETLVIPPREVSRQRAADLLTGDMTPNRMLAIIGPPDDVTSNRISHTWIYDIDGDPAFAIEIDWPRGRIRRDAVPTWQRVGFELGGFWR